MDFRYFVASLNQQEVAELSSALYKRQELDSKDRMRNEVLNEFERDLVRTGDIIGAIKEVRRRTNCILRDAKTLVDDYKTAIDFKASIDRKKVRDGFLSGTNPQAPEGYKIRCSGCKDCEKFGHLPMIKDKQ